MPHVSGEGVLAHLNWHAELRCISTNVITAVPMEQVRVITNAVFFQAARLCPVDKSD
jgi:hypothetical protein